MLIAYDVRLNKPNTEECSCPSMLPVFLDVLLEQPVMNESRRKGHRFKETTPSSFRSQGNVNVLRLKQQTGHTQRDVHGRTPSHFVYV